MFIQSRRAGLAGLILCLFSFGASAQEYPTKPIRLVVPFPAGGTTDIMARALQNSVSETLGQRIVIDNRLGASGVIGARDVAHSAPDGYTLFFTQAGPAAIAPAMQASVGYDPIADFTPITLVATAPFLLVVHPSLGVNDLQGLIKLAKDSPGTITYASPGVGSVGHLAVELLQSTSGIKLRHVPFKGQADLLLSVLSGEVKMTLTSPSATMSDYIKSGRLKLIGVSSPEPSPLAPGAPPIQSVVPNSAFVQWFGITAAAKTSPEIVAKLNKAFEKALASADVQARFMESGAIAQSSSPEALGKLIASEVPRWKEVVQRAQIPVE